MSDGKRGDGREPRGPLGGGAGPSAPVPVAPAPVAAPAAQAPAPAQTPQTRRAPATSAPPPDIPSTDAPVPRPAPAPIDPSQATTAGQRPGTAASQQALAARAGVRLGAFDPRQRATEEQSAISALLGAGGAGPQVANAAGAPIPPSLGFGVNQYEDEQRILGALRGQ